MNSRRSSALRGKPPLQRCQSLLVWRGVHHLHTDEVNDERDVGKHICRTPVCRHTGVHKRSALILARSASWSLAIKGRRKLWCHSGVLAR
ncbi:hypothetical protein E2C01_072014 [Portunus trituberculatus]|uniref:Uncharacterized protein n=1 Tax=Portunus trituberculatus TaxID=210409 RepID=A0A5B7I7U0_PORTR|nr:hypothetical protein [Portunus trituberculatus]